MNSNNEIITLDAVPVDQVIDTLGAGDSFIAGLVSRLSQQHKFETALKFANKLAARKIQFQGIRFEVIPV